MNYTAIRNQIVRIDNTLELVPVKLLSELVGKVDDNLYIDLWSLHEVEIPGIHCIVHAVMDYDYCRYHAVGTVVIENVPAFFFTAGGREGEDHCNYYVLSAEATKAFIKYLIDISVQKALDKVELTELVVVEELPELSEFYGEEIRYGIGYYYNSYSHCYIANTK